MGKAVEVWDCEGIEGDKRGEECVYCSVISFIQSFTDIIVLLADVLVVTLSSLVDPPSCSLTKV